MNYIIKAFLICLVFAIIILAIKPFLTTNQINGNDNNSINYPAAYTTQPKIVNTKGELLFKNNCASCHNIFRDLTGPSLKDVINRGPWADRKNLYDWIHNPPKFMVLNEYARSLQKKYGTMMQAFPTLKEEDIDAIVEYIKEMSLQEQGLVAL